MQKLWQRIAEVLRLSHLEMRWNKLASVLAIAVVFCTTYMLILPAITMEKETFCGYEEHLHSDGCYASTDSESEMMCGMEEHLHDGYCYFDPNDATELETEVETGVQEAPAPKQKQYSDDSVTVKATYLPSADIPDEAQLMVKKIEKSDEYENCYEEAIKTIESANGEIKTSNITDFQLYDISFVISGEEIQPKDTVDISISFPADNITETSEISVVHYAKDGVQLAEVQEYEMDNDGNLNTSFETDSFSLFAVVTAETQTNYIVSLSKFNITTQNISSLGGKTYAIVSGDYALYADNSGNLVSKMLASGENNNKIGDESIVRWTFTRNGNSGSNYYISTTINNTTYYLRFSSNTLSLTTSQSSRTSFTATRSGTNLTLRSGTNNYINISANGVSTGSSSALSLYSVPTGQFTVNFDGQLGYPTYMSSSNKKYTGAENVQVKTDSQGYVTLPTAESTKVPGNYPLRLNGWYDIVNKIYYDSSMLGKRIKVTNNTIFYAEWIAETYDIGQNVDVVQGQPDTSSFITTKVFDYNELFNMHSSNYSQSSGTWTFDPNSELGFIFFDYLTNGNISYMNNKDVAVDGITVNAEKTNGTRGSSTNFPGTITAGIANEARLDALFGPDPIPGRISLGEGDWLYSYDEETGYYYYNSAKNATSYNQSDQRFYVYNYVVNIDSQNSLNDFLPLNYGKRQYKEKDNEANYWFGMSSEITFYLPEDSGSGKNKAANDVDMQLRFSGDDDVWIFIDGQLALDLGGVHDVVYGEVNFSTGKVKTGQAISKSEVADNTATDYSGMPGVSGNVGVTTTDLPMKLEGGKEHTITVYYLERGSSLSNCAIYFNLSPSYELEITKKDKQGEKLLEGAQFRIFDDAACTQPSLLYTVNKDGTLTEDADSTFTTDENGIASCMGLLANRTYYIKEVEPPLGYPDMSDYVIKVNLNDVGEATFIATDSNGEQWTFADSYTISNDNEHRIELNVYNDIYIGGEKSLYVEKQWAQGSTNIPDEIVVRLYSDGEKTSRTIVLKAENGWHGEFYNLPVKDESGKEIIYSVVEESSISGYVATYEQIDLSQVNQLTDGATYRFVVPEYNNWAVKARSASSQGVEPAVVSASDNSQLWIAKKSGNYVILQNKAYPSRYLSIGTDTNNGIAAVTTTNDARNLISLENGKLTSSAGGYLRSGVKTSISSSGAGFRGTDNVNDAADIIAYRLLEEPGWRITNTPKIFNIPVEKHWHSTVSDENRKEVSLNLYLVTDGIAEKTDELLLDSSNGWQGSFDNLPYPSQGSYYCVVEDTDKYSVVYSGKTASVLINNENREVAVVEIDDNNDAVKIEITNYPLVLLPETGGKGIEKYIIGGLLTVLSSVFLLCYKVNRERRRKRSAV